MSRTSVDHLKKSPHKEGQENWHGAREKSGQTDRHCLGTVGESTKDRAGLRKPRGTERRLQPQKLTHLTHDVFIVRQRQAQVGDVPIVALRRQGRERVGTQQGSALKK